MMMTETEMNSSALAISFFNITVSGGEEREQVGSLAVYLYVIISKNKCV
jgi:hypothetical protein